MEYDKLKNKLQYDSCVYPLPEDHVLRKVSSDSETIHIAKDKDDVIGKENLCDAKGRYMRRLQRSTEKEEICDDCIEIAGYFEEDNITGFNVRYIEFLDKVKIEERSDKGELLWYKYLEPSKTSKLGRRLTENPLEF